MPAISQKTRQQVAMMDCASGHSTAFDLDGIEDQLRAGRDAWVQFDKPFGDSVDVLKLSANEEDSWTLAPSAPYLERLDALCARWGERLTVRFYGHYGQVFDAKVLKLLPNIRALSIDCIQEATNLDEIVGLEHLEQLHLGIFGLEDKAILGKLRIKQFRGLTLSQTNTKALDLAPLAEASNLKTLYLDGHHKNIAALAHLDQLETFTFNAKKGLDLAFVNGMRNLQALKFNLGGTVSIEEIQLPDLKDLAFTMTRGLTELGDMQRFPRLCRLLMQDQQHVGSIRFGRDNVGLEHLWFHNCRSLSELHGLAACPKLTSIRSVATKLDAGSLTLPPSLTHLYVLSGQRKEEARELATIEKMGLTAAPHDDALFFYK